MDGQLASASDGKSVETFLRDGLALIRRDSTNYVNEPYVTGGNPVIAGDKTLFNDMLGSTLGAKNGEEFTAIERDAFGQTETASDHDFFTGKPQVGCVETNDAFEENQDKNWVPRHPEPIRPE